MNKLIFCVIGLLLGYGAGAAFGALAVELSSNTHDKAVEMATTALIATGPAGAVAGAVTGWFFAKRFRKQPL